MAMDKRHQEILDRLDAIEETLRKMAGKGTSAKPVTKEQLMEIDGVGAATANKILKLLGQ